MTDEAAALAEAQQIAHIGSWEWDVRADRIMWSDELYRIFGLNPESFEASYEAYLGCLHPDDVELVNGTVQSAFATHEPFEFDHRVIRPDGEVRTLHGRGRVFVDEAGETVRMAGTGQDITELRRTEQRLRETAAELERRDLSLSHARELNDSIVQALVLARYAFEQGDGDGARELVDQTLERARAMIRDLLAGSDVEAGDLRRRRPAV
jgi:PAS domain S-box-containing protein